jgi:predicted nucleic acid-binding protein
MTRTYADAGVLIAVFRGEPPLARLAISLLEDPGRTFVASRFLRLETLPKATFHRKQAEAAYYTRFFAEVVAWAEPIDQVVDLAEREAASYGLSALDALHVAAAILLDADELVTTEGLLKPIHRVAGLKIVTL